MAHGQAALEDVVLETLNTNPEILSAREDEKSARARVQRAWSTVLPTVEIEADARQRTSDTVPNQGENPDNPYSYAVTASMPIFDGGRGFNRIRAARESARAAAASTADVEQRILLDTILAHVRVLVDTRQVQHRLAQVESLEGLSRRTNRQFDLGDATRTDVDQVRARLAAASGELEESRARLRTSEARYTRLSGRTHNQVVKVRSVRHAIPSTLPGVLALSRQNNPRLQSTAHTAKAARHDVQAAAGAFLPTVSLEAEHSEDFNVSSTVDRQESSYVGVRMSMPLFAGGERIADVREKRALAKRRQHEVANANRLVDEAATSAWHDLRAARQRITLAKAQKDAAAGALKGVKREVMIDTRSIYDILNAQDDLVDASIALDEAAYALTSSEHLLLAQMGILKAIYAGDDVGGAIEVIQAPIVSGLREANAADHVSVDAQGTGFRTSSSDDGARKPSRRGGFFARLFKRHRERGEAPEETAALAAIPPEAAPVAAAADAAMASAMPLSTMTDDEAGPSDAPRSSEAPASKRQAPPLAPLMNRFIYGNE